MIEIWKDIKGYEGLYQVSNLGRLKSYQRVKAGKLVSLQKTKDGYLQTDLYKDKVRKAVRIHRLVAEAFIPNPDGKLEVNHKNGNKENNEVDNLEWSTKQENIDHAHDNNLYDNIIGEKHGRAKLSDLDVEFIKKNFKPYDKEFGAKPLAKKYGVSDTQIRHIVKGRSRK